MATSPQFPATPIVGGANLTDITLTTLLTAGANGAYVEKIVYYASNNESASLNIFVSVGGNDFQVDSDIVGTGGTFLLDFAIPAGASIKVQLSGAPTGAVSVVAFGGDY